MDKVSRWKVRDGNEKDMEKILSLRNLVFGEVERDKLDPTFWNWQMNENPDGKAWIYIAEDGNQIIGHLADLPKRFVAGGKLVLGSLTHDMMVHPQYRRKGISSATAEYGIHRVEREKGMFMTAYSIRVESLNSLLKVGWKEVMTLPVLVLPIRFSGIVNRYLPSKALSLLIGGVMRLCYFLLFSLRKKGKREGRWVERVYQWDELFDLFWERAKSVNPIMGNRDRNFLTWRFLRHPTRHYVIYRALHGGEMKGYIVLRKVELLKLNSSVIVDLLALDDQTLSELLEKGIEHSRQEGADLLGFMVPKPHVYHRTLRKRGFLPSLKAFHFLVYSRGKERFFFDPEEWYVTWGDTDVI